MFRMNGFNVLAHGLHRISELTGRDDLQVRILDPAEVGTPGPPGPCLVLGLREGAVSPHPRNEILCAGK